MKPGYKWRRWTMCTVFFHVELVPCYFIRFHFFPINYEFQFQLAQVSNFVNIDTEIFCQLEIFIFDINPAVRLLLCSCKQGIVLWNVKLTNRKSYIGYSFVVCKTIMLPVDMKDQDLSLLHWALSELWIDRENTYEFSYII